MQSYFLCYFLFVNYWKVIDILFIFIHLALIILNCIVFCLFFIKWLVIVLTCFLVFLCICLFVKTCHLSIAEICTFSVYPDILSISIDCILGPSFNTFLKYRHVLKNSYKDIFGHQTIIITYKKLLEEVVWFYTFFCWSKLLF